MPFFSGMGMVVMPGIEKSGYKFATVHTDAERMAWSAIIEANMKAAVDTTHEYGKKASPAVGRL